MRLTVKYSKRGPVCLVATLSSGRHLVGCIQGRGSSRSGGGAPPSTGSGQAATTAAGTAALLSRVLESPFPSWARTHVASTDSAVNPMPEFLAAIELDTLVKAKAKADPQMQTDVLVIGAGPTG